MRRVIVLGIAVLMMVALAGPAMAQYKATMKFGSTQTLDHPYMIGAQKFADLIKERTNGRIQIKLYPSSQLGKGEREMCEGLQTGAVELLVTSTGPLGGFSPAINILDFPYLFRDFAHVDSVMDGPIGRKLLDGFEKAGLKGFAIWENGFRHLTNAKRQVKKVDEAKGLKIRTMENKMHLAAWKTAGLNPTPMAWGEGLHGVAAGCHRRPGKPDCRLLRFQVVGRGAEEFLPHLARLLPLPVLYEQEGL